MYKTIVAHKPRQLYQYIHHGRLSLYRRVPKHNKAKEHESIYLGMHRILYDNKIDGYDFFENNHAITHYQVL